MKAHARCIAVGLAAAVMLLPGVAPAQLQSRQLVQEVGLDQHLGAQLPLDAVLQDESGQTIELRQLLDDRPVILNFVYYRCPMLCTQVLNGLLRASQAMEFTLGEEYQIVSISIDPRETPAMAAAKKKSYVASYRRPGAEKGWHFLTANSDTIDQLTRIAGFRYRYDEASDQYAHASGLMLVTPEGKISRYYYGIDFTPTDLRLGLIESSENRIGTLVDQVLLLCYHYDPATGKYGVAIARLIRLAGVSTMLCLGLFLVRMYRLEQRRTAEVQR